MGDTPEAIQARLDEKRAALPPKPEPEMQVCSECGKEFEKPKGGNIRLPAGVEVQPMCRECYGAFRQVTIPTPEFRSTSPEIEGLQGLEKVGVNVRRHGKLLLADVGGEAETAGRSFIGDVLSAGKYGEVQGLFVWGGTGTGKSQFAVAVVHELLRMGVLRHHEIVYDSARRMVTQLQDRYSTGGVDEFSERRQKARLWVYEDAGTEKLTPDAFRVVETIFDAREGHPTIVTSNLSRQALAEKWAQMDVVGRFLSRLRAYRSLAMVGSDRR